MSKSKKMILIVLSILIVACITFVFVYQLILKDRNETVEILESYTDTDRWKLVWSDEFNDDKLDEDNWNFDLGNFLTDINGNLVTFGWGNQELQYFTDKEQNVNVKDGNLNVTVKYEPFEYKQVDKICSYSSGRINTKDKFSFKYGRVEIRAKLPAGKALWPAFWLMPEKEVYGSWAASGEIDIMEAKGRIDNEVHGTIHYGGTYGHNTYTENIYTFPDGTNYTDYHVYSLEWDEGEMRWYVDGELYATQNEWYTNKPDGTPIANFPAPFDQEFYLILSLSVGGRYDIIADPDNDTIDGSTMSIDYVRIYDKI